jgi:hypothetical protein
MKREVRDIEFIDSTRSVYQNYPVKLSKEVLPHFAQKQIDTYGQFKFPHCPGLIDYAQLGYIIPAWVDMHIKANKSGVKAFIGSLERGTHGFQEPEPMASDIVDGVFHPDGVPLGTLKFPSPWKIFARKDVSALVIPATYHSNFLDDLHVWPGVVDYGKFHVINFMCAPKRDCEIHIKVGDPLLQVIPFINTPMQAGFGPGTDEQLDSCINEIPGDDSNFYRKFMRLPKIFKLFGADK